MTTREYPWGKSNANITSQSIQCQVIKLSCPETVDQSVFTGAEVIWWYTGSCSGELIPYGKSLYIKVKLACVLVPPKLIMAGDIHLRSSVLSDWDYSSLGVTMRENPTAPDFQFTYFISTCAGADDWFTDGGMLDIGRLDWVLCWKQILHSLYSAWVKMLVSFAEDGYDRWIS